MLYRKNTCLVILGLALVSCREKPQKSLKALSYEKVSESVEQSPKEDQPAVLSPNEVQARLAALETPEEAEKPLEKAQAPRTLSDGAILELCQRGQVAACHRYGYRLASQGNYPNAERFYSVACARGYMKSCNNLGWNLEKKGLLSQASNFYAQACLDKHPGACKNLKRANSKLRDTLLRR